jgi:hypothetical protein
MAWVRKFTLSLALLLLVLCVGAAAAKAPSARVKQTRSPLVTLAMDGSRVAYASGGKVYVWNVVTGKTSLLRGSYGKHTAEVAIAGGRVAWITRYVIGNTLQTTEYMFTAPIGSRGKLIASGRRYLSRPASGDSAWYGRWIAGAVGSGNVLAVSTWWSAHDGTCTGQRLSTISASGLRQIASGPGAIMSASAGSGRIAVLRSEEAWPYGGRASNETPATVGIYSANGNLLEEITPSSAEEVALSGSTLAVLTETKTLEIYDWTTGTLLHRWPVASSTPKLEAGHLAVYGKVGVYSVDPRRAAARTLHVINLTTGKDAVLVSGRGTGYYSRDAAIGPRGLVYAVNYHEHGRLTAPERGKLVFVPLTKVLAKVR